MLYPLSLLGGGAESKRQETHIKTAIDAAQAKYNEAGVDSTVVPSTCGARDRPLRGDKPFLFVTGDISGIQRYIFDLKTTKDNAKLLRARSNQIAQLGRDIAKRIVDSCGMGKDNIITYAGGKFIVLLPNTKTTKDTLDKLRLETEQKLLDDYAGRLTVAISRGVEAGKDDTQAGKVRHLLNEIARDGEDAKQHKMQAVLRERRAVLNGIYGELQEHGECPVCGIFGAGEEADGKSTPCKRCRALIEEGRKIAQVPRDDMDNVLTFEEIAARAQGVKHLAMFKADVDNLGWIFSSWHKDVTLPIYAEMSALFDGFFRVYYEHFIETAHAPDGTAYKDVIYTVFTGGDDMCLLGAWNYVMQFARDWHEEFLKFTKDCKDEKGYEAVTLSAGIALFQPNEPLRSVAESAEDELDVSKDGGKNAITVFGTRVSWEDYSKALDDGVFLSEAMSNKVSDEKRLSTGVVYRLLDLADRAKRCKKFMEYEDNGQDKDKDKRVALRERDWLWQSALRYTAFRNIKDEGVLKMYCGFGAGNNPDAMMATRIAASYALYMNRGVQDTQNNGGK